MTDTLPPIPSATPTAAADDADVWPASGPAKGFRVRLPIAVAALVVVGLVGAAGGAALKKSSGTTTQAGAISNNRARLGANGANGAGGATGANGAAGANRPATAGGVFGTVSKVEGNTVTITQRDGSTATVVVPSGTTITKTVNGSLSDLTSGTSVVVRGTTADGKTTASDITIAPAGATGANGFGGFGGFGGAGGFGARRGTGTGTGSGTPTD